MSNQIPPQIQSALSDLRWRIRAYVFIEGLALAAVWLGLTFWIGLAIDYLPVMVWASEIPRGVRAVGLAGVALVLAWILYRWVLRRVFTRLSDRSMALLMERRFREFGDGLVTTVELSEGDREDGTYSPELLAVTRQQAAGELTRHHLGAIFNARPMTRNVVLALALLAPIAGLHVLLPGVTQTWFQRFYALRDIPWPRATVLEVVGLEVSRSGQDAEPRRMEFDDRAMKIARGANGKLQVRARSRQRGAEPPDYCTIYYRTQSGVRSSVKMAQVGRVARDGFQTYEISSKPFQGILEDLTFDVKANDLRVNGFRLKVVDSPEVVDIQLASVFPGYLVDERTSSFLPRTQAYVQGGTTLPQGTSVTVKLESSKPLQSVVCRTSDGGDDVPVPLTSESAFEFPIAKLMDSVSLEFVLTDQDQVQSEAPVRVQLSVREDSPPSLDSVTHRGIGSLVTRDFILPIQGEVRDGYRVDEVWAEVDVAGRPAPLRFPLGAATSDVVDLTGQTIDFRAARGRDPEPVELKVADRIAITLKASDRFDLTEKPNVGASVRLELEVVTPEQLLASLDQRELAQRKAFEHAMEEMTATRDDLDRVRQAAAQSGGAVDPLEVLEQDDAKLSPEQIKRRQEALRMLRVQQASLQSEKSAVEVIAVAKNFQEVLLEMTNNRLESSDRHERIQKKIVEPVLTIGETMFPALDARLADLEKSFADPEKNRAAAAAAVAQVDDILKEMNLVLQDMLYIETYNELVETVRLLLEEHTRILEETQNERKRNALRGLLD